MVQPFAIMIRRRLIFALMGLLTITGRLWADSITSDSLPSFNTEAGHSSAILPPDFHLKQDTPLQLQPPFETRAPQGSSCYVLPGSVSMPSPLRSLGINLDMNLLVQDVGMGPICATGVGLMFGSTLQNR